MNYIILKWYLSYLHVTISKSVVLQLFKTLMYNITLFYCRV